MKLFDVYTSDKVFLCSVVAKDVKQAIKRAQHKFPNLNVQMFAKF